jgi:hypothetical protein
MAQVPPDPAFFDRNTGEEKAGIPQCGKVTSDQCTPLLALMAFGGKTGRQLPDVLEDGMDIHRMPPSCLSF